MDFDVRDRWLSLRTLASVAARFDDGRLEMGQSVFAPDAEIVVDGDRMTILHEGWRLKRYLRYRPLIYFAAFGDTAVFDCLRMAIASLFEFGRYDGEVLVLTDTAHLDLAGDLPDILRSRVATRALSAADMLDWTLARYRIADMPEFARHRPYLYLDMDVICNGSLEPLLKRLAISDVLNAPAENTVMSPDNSYGASLFVADGLNLPQEVRGFSTGLLGFPDIATVASLFALVPRLASTYAASAGRRDIFGCYDQPFTNYAAIKTCRVDLTLLDRFLDNRWYWHDRLPERRGLTHFTGGTDRSAPKAEVMANYLRHLRAMPHG